MNATMRFTIVESSAGATVVSTIARGMVDRIRIPTWETAISGATVNRIPDVPMYAFSRDAAMAHHRLISDAAIMAHSNGTGKTRIRSYSIEGEKING